jgi:hypothetical protein
VCEVWGERPKDEPSRHHEPKPVVTRVSCGSQMLGVRRRIERISRETQLLVVRMMCSTCSLAALNPRGGQEPLDQSQLPALHHREWEWTFGHWGSRGLCLRLPGAQQSPLPEGRQAKVGCSDGGRSGRRHSTACLLPWPPQMICSKGSYSSMPPILILWLWSVLRPSMLLWEKIGASLGGGC